MRTAGKNVKKKKQNKSKKQQKVPEVRQWCPGFPERVLLRRGAETPAPLSGQFFRRLSGGGAVHEHSPETKPMDAR